MLNLDTYPYVSDYYHSQILLSTYLGCVRPVGVHSNWRVVNDDVKALPLIFKRPAKRHKKLRISSIGEVNSSSTRCSSSIFLYQ